MPDTSVNFPLRPRRSRPMSGRRNWLPSLATPSRAPTHGKRTGILRSMETVRWTFSPSDAFVGDRCETELETTYEKNTRKTDTKATAMPPDGGIDVLAELAGLKVDLKQQWRKLFASEPPPFNRRYLKLRVGYRIQELAHGGLRRETRCVLGLPADEVSRAARAARTGSPTLANRWWHQAHPRVGRRGAHGHRCWRTASNGKVDASSRSRPPSPAKSPGPIGTAGASSGSSRREGSDDRQKQA